MIKKILSFRTKYSIKLRLQKFKAMKYFNDVSFDSRKNRAFIFLAADYGNLGDVAITFAQTQFLKENLADNFEVIEIPISKSLEGLHFVKRHIKDGDIITTVGGGNMGDMYDQIEYIRQLVIRIFSKNKIISFPQTFDFSESPEGRKALQLAIKTYSAHNNLVIVARENISFELMTKNFTANKVILTPDIVLSLNLSDSKIKRTGVVFCLRRDTEKALTDEQNTEIITLASEKFDAHSFYDTHIGRGELSQKERQNQLTLIWNKFKGAELVITDRLHGMIFCYITNTPCIVFQNNNHKVRETHKWLPENSCVRLLESFSVEGLERAIEELKYTDPYTTLHAFYKPLLKELK